MLNPGGMPLGRVTKAVFGLIVDYFSPIDTYQLHCVIQRLQTEPTHWIRPSDVYYFIF